MFTRRASPSVRSFSEDDLGLALGPCSQSWLVLAHTEYSEDDADSKHAQQSHSNHVYMENIGQW